MNNIIWLSGSRGFIGSYLKDALIGMNKVVQCVSNSYTADNEIIFFDFSKKESINEVLKKYGTPDTFIHLGWGNVYEPHNECHVNENLMDGQNLIDELYAAGVKRILLIGSSSEYGDREGALEESSQSMGEVNNYVKGKTTLSRYGVSRAKEIGRYFLHIRLFYTYGSGQKHNSLINQLFQSYLSDSQMSLSPCEHYRDYIHVLDAAKGIAKLSDVNYSGVINLGSGNVIMLQDFVRLFWNELNADPSQLKFGEHDLSSLEQSQPKSFANLSKLVNLTNWSPELSINQGIKQTVQQMLNEYKDNS
jgi:nucleoside-diphosphate-sugar epimerase